MALLLCKNNYIVLTLVPKPEKMFIYTYIVYDAPFENASNIAFIEDTRNAKRESRLIKKEFTVYTPAQTLNTYDEVYIYKCTMKEDV